MTLVARHAALSDIGLHRASNEDSYAIAGSLYVIADGMGGAQAGEVASRTAVEALAGLVAAGTSPADAAAEANRTIHELARGDEQRQGMGTTLTGLVLAGDSAEVVHIGDSRLYRLRDGSLEQLTSDHSMVGQWLREGTITPEEAAVSRYRSVLTRALGTEPEVEIDAFSIDVKAGDRLLLCSDGLSGLVPDEVISGILGQGPPDVAARELVREAKNRGGYDNITVIVLRVDEIDADRRAAATAAADGDPPPVLPTPSRGRDGEPRGPRDGATGDGRSAISSATTPSVMAGVIEAPEAAARSRRRHRVLLALLVAALAVLVVAVLVVTGVVDPSSFGVGGWTVVRAAARAAAPGAAA